jgi:hypothetical protein
LFPDTLRAEARELVEEFDFLLPFRGKGTALEHAQGELLLIKMARYLPKVVEIKSWPADNTGAFAGEE